MQTLNLSDTQLTALPESFAQITQLQTLNLSGNYLTALSEWLGQLTQLRTLNLSDSRLTVLPEWLGQLMHLQTLHLSGNRLTALPEWLGQLRQLQTLNLSDNRLAALPESLGQLAQLQTLNLSDNRLTELPEPLGQLTQLQNLDLSNNQLTAVPETLGQLAELQALHLSSNRLQALPASICRLVRLKTLSLAINPLASLPPCFGDLRSIQTLTLGGTNISSLPRSFSNMESLKFLFLSDTPLSQVTHLIGRLKTLEVLDLSNKRGIVSRWEPGHGWSWYGGHPSQGVSLTELPRALLQLTALRELYLQGNESLELPLELLGPDWHEVHDSRQRLEPASPSDILAYYFRAKMAATPLLEFKLILVGHGAVGKTTLVNRLVRDEFTQPDMTRGIHIEKWSVQAGADTVAAHVWDFGGQDIMHGTHQFFLTHRSLYLLVLAARESRQNDDAEYWLKTITAFGGDSPVIVVLNKSDELAFDVNENALRKKYPSIRAFIKTDCRTARGINNLRAEISKAADGLDGVRDLFPEQWFAIKDRISGMKESFLTFEQFRDECVGLGETEADGQENLAAVLHVLGIALNFRDDERLRETSVLNPLWVTGGIYSLLNDSELATRHGLLTLQDFARVLPVEEYPPDTHAFLRELMGKFELCFPLGEHQDEYLIPELLSQQEPDAVGALDVNQSLAFSYHYPRLLPHGLVPRLIVRLYPLIDDELRWRSGVVLEWFKARALVKADSDDRSVRIRVHGDKTRSRELLAIIRTEFDTLHRQFHGLLPTERVQLPDYPDVAVDYSHLEAASRARLKVMPVFTEGNMIQVSPNEILKCFEVPGEPRDAGDRGASEIEPTPPTRRPRKGGRK